jgi:hypothetical protein
VLRDSIRPIAHGCRAENFTDVDRPLAHGRPPVQVGGRQTDLTEHNVDHAVDDLAFVAHMAVQRHRLDAERLGELAHAERLDAVRIGQVEGSAQHALAAQGHTALGGGLGRRGHGVSPGLAIDKPSLHCYGDDVTLTLYAKDKGAAMPMPITRQRSDQGLDHAHADGHHKTPTDATPDTRNAHAKSMQAIVQDHYGSPSVLLMQDIDKPAIGVDDVLVRVHAAVCISATGT